MSARRLASFSIVGLEDEREVLEEEEKEEGGRQETEERRTLRAGMRGASGEM